MAYFYVFVLLLLIELSYFWLADRFNIVDKPNLRSSHSSVTLRGGGVIFFIGVLLFYLCRDFSYSWFFLGLTLMSSISFLDDVFSLSNRIRLLVHFVSVFLLIYQLGLFDADWFVLSVAVVLIVGVINAYNFMDGINGITASYSMSLLILLIMVNHQIRFVEADLLYFVALSVTVFAIFNFRMKAKCFAGDVGSVSIAYILLFCIGALILKTGNPVYIMFLSVYGVDAIWTIVRRLYLRENIFEPHRSHLYQYLANEAGVNKLLVSSAYGLIQLFIGYLVILISGKSGNFQIIFSISLLLLLSTFYLIGKHFVILKYVKINRS